MLLQTQATLTQVASSGQQRQNSHWPGIKLVGAGLSRTGTESLVTAMKMLGEHPSHGEEFKDARTPLGHIVPEASRGKPERMLATLEHENVTSVFDGPLNSFVDLFRKRYDSKVILSIHPKGADGWAESLVKFARLWQIESAYKAPPMFH